MPGFHLQCGVLDSSQASAYASGLSFDFSSDIPSGEKILAYAVALSGCNVNYATQSSVSYEPVARFGIKLVPSLTGNVVSVSVGIVLTDYDGDAASEAQDVSDRESVVAVTVIVYSDTSADNSWRLCNAFGLDSDAWTNDIPIPSGDPLYSRVMIAGFDFSYTDNDSHGIDSLKVVTGLQAGGEANTAQIQGTCTMDSGNKYSNSSTVDLAYLFQPQPQGSAVSTIQFVDINPSWGSVSSGGMSADFSETVDVPDGYQLSKAAVVMSKLDLDFGSHHDVGSIVLGLGDTAAPAYDPTTTGQTTITGTLRMNLYADELPSKQIASDSSTTASLVVIFTPVATN